MIMRKICRFFLKWHQEAICAYIVLFCLGIILYEMEFLSPTSASDTLENNAKMKKSKHGNNAMSTDKHEDTAKMASYGFADNAKIESNRLRDHGKLVNNMHQNNTQIATSRKSAIIITWFHLYHKILTHHTSLFDWKRCEYSNCELTFRTLLPPDGILRVKSDAVLLQGNNLYPAIVKRRNYDQVFVFVSYEPPSYMHSELYKSPEIDGIFNWTMTYRLDSDIPYRYGEFVPKTKDASADKNYTKILREKHKMAVWIVSHCNTTSKRETYVEKLSKYIDVDTFGDCFNGKECSRTNQTECFDYIERTYKFYLAFENSFCHDYITEKAYNWTARNIIVVVRGPPQYHHHLPTGSYIDTRDFRTVKDLAQYLTHVANDDHMYLKYLRAREKYVLRSMYNQPQIAYCQLCEKLNHLDSNRRSYKSISDWWSGTGICWNSTDDIR